MPKIKTYKAAAKRLKVTGSGKVMRTKSEKRHLRRKKTSRAKRSAWKMVEIESATNRQRALRLAPYIGKNK